MTEPRDTAVRRGALTRAKGAGPEQARSGGLREALRPIVADWFDTGYENGKLDADVLTDRVLAALPSQGAAHEERGLRTALLRVFDAAEDRPDIRAIVTETLAVDYTQNGAAHEERGLDVEREEDAEVRMAAAALVAALHDDIATCGASSQKAYERLAALIHGQGAAAGERIRKALAATPAPSTEEPE